MFSKAPIKEQTIFYPPKGIGPRYSAKNSKNINRVQNHYYRSRLGTFSTYEVWVSPWKLAPARRRIGLFLYNQKKYHATQEQENLYTFWVSNTSTTQVEAVLDIHSDPGTLEAWSLLNAPFGGIQHESDVPVEVVLYLLQCVENWCSANTIRKITIKAPPILYDKRQVNLTRKVYLESGFTESNKINHHIPVLSSLFMCHILPPEKRRFRKSIKAGFTGTIWENPDPEQVYNFLQESRNRQGYTLSISLPQLRELLTKLPKEATVFVVRDGSEIVCLTVAIRASQAVLYNFCPADNLDYRTYSPTVLLNATLYEYAQKEGIEAIDLGTSLDHLGNEKSSLMRFKENLGGVRSMKVTYEKIVM